MSDERAIELEHVRRVRLGSGANCSSIGSVVDTLFAASVAGSALFVAVLAALKSESVRVTPGPTATPNEELSAPRARTKGNA